MMIEIEADAEIRRAECRRRPRTERLVGRA